MCCTAGAISQSRPARGAWIEIQVYLDHERRQVWSRPARGAWIEIQVEVAGALEQESRPARGAWIEIKRYAQD